MKAIAKIVLAFACLASVWLYVSRVLVPHQRSVAASTGSPRGNLSDLYPVWLGSRELLLRGRDPYSAELTREIQVGYYGRELDSSKTQDPTNRQAFAYPVYVAFVLSPTVNMQFETAQSLFRWLLTLLTCVSVCLWLRVLRWRPGWSTNAVCVVLTLATFAAIQGIRLQQLSLLVAPLVAASLALLVSGQLILSGILLALAMIKPQLTFLLALWLLLWTFGDLRRRWRFAAAFLVSMAALVIGGEWILSGWIGKFRDAIAAYKSYAASGSLLGWMFSPGAGITMAAVILAAMAAAGWRNRKSDAQNESFVRLTSLGLAVTLLIIPMFPPHYQLLLLPAALVLVRDWRELSKADFASRALLRFSAIALLWQWISAAVLATLSFFTSAAQRFWQLPLWTNVILPIPLAACLALWTYQQSRLRRATSSVPQTGN